MDEGRDSTTAASGDHTLDAAARALVAGQAVVVPTDTVYGVAALPTVPGATARLFRLKHRAEEQPLAVLVADAEQALPLVELADERVLDLMSEHWPGPLTLVLRRSAAAREMELGGGRDTIGVRCPAHDLVRELATRVGPIATTSANRSGEPTPTSAAGAAAALDGEVAVVLDGGICAGTPSTVLDVQGPSWKILRFGPTVTDIPNALREGG